MWGAPCFQDSNRGRIVIRGTAGAGGVRPEDRNQASRQNGSWGHPGPSDQSGAPPWAWEENPDSAEG